ncbi:hypothetical protein Lal_00033821 [Lupinus albus]|nr:hypothetical protein Lal_00033821 [Lupinus albus]
MPTRLSYMLKDIRRCLGNLTQHNRCFIKWLKHHIDEELNINADSISERLKWLANGPSIHILSYSGYLINVFTFYTEKHDDKSKSKIASVPITTNDDLYTRDDHDEGLWVNEILSGEDNNITSQKPSKKRKK